MKTMIQQMDTDFLSALLWCHHINWLSSKTMSLIEQLPDGEERKSLTRRL